MGVQITATDEPKTLEEIRTPALVVDNSIFSTNLAAMSEVRPGVELRPHVKAFKSTALAGRLAAIGHTAFCAATSREIEGLVHAGLGHDVLLANESFDVGRLGELARQATPDQPANITVAVDSAEMLDAAIAAGIPNVLIDINVGLPRCGCDLETGLRLADQARAAGIEVRGVMGYEGHLMMVAERDKRVSMVEESMQTLVDAGAKIGGDIVSGGGTGTFDTNTFCTEIQAGSYTLMDTQYAQLDLPFEIALTVLATVISVNPAGWIVANAGLKSLGMDHGDPSWSEGDVFFCSDEHITLSPTDLSRWKVGDQVHLQPAHVDPTVAKHQQMWLTEGEDVIDRWDVDLRHW